MRISVATGESASPPHIYNQLDQRLSRQGVQLHQLIKDYAAALPVPPSSLEELQEQVTSVLGKWSADPAMRVLPETPLAQAHLQLMDDLCAERGNSPTTRLETDLVRVIANQFARNLGSPLRLPDENRLIPFTEVRPANAYSALTQRAALEGVSPHECVKEWVQSNQVVIRRQPISEFGYLRLAQKLCGAWPEKDEPRSAFQKSMSAFLDGVALATSRNHAITVQSSLTDVFARAIRRQVRNMGLDRPAGAIPSVSIA